MKDPNEFHIAEVTLGPPVKVSCTFRMCLPMETHVQHLAWTAKCDKSVIVRQALHEYFERRGIDAWI